MPAVRRLKFFPTQRPPLLSPNLPLTEAMAIYLRETTTRLYSARFHHFLNLATYFMECCGPSVRVKDCRPRKHAHPYTAFRRKDGEPLVVIEQELESLSALLEAARVRGRRVAA